MSENDRLTPDEVAAQWNIAVKTLYRWNSDKKHPSPKGFKIGRSLMWVRKDVDAYVRYCQEAA